MVCFWAVFDKTTQHMLRCIYRVDIDLVILEAVKGSFYDIDNT